MWPAIIAGAAALGGSLINSFSNKSSQSSANKQNMEIARYQNEWNQQQWNRENQYTEAMYQKYGTPAAAMQQYRDAGLNPNLIYGQGTLTPPSTASSPRAVGAHIRPYTGFNLGINEGVQASLQSLSTRSQIALQRSQANYTDQQAANEAIKASGYLTQNARSKLDLSIADSLKQTSIDAAKQSLRNQMLQGDDLSFKLNNLNHVDMHLKQQGIEINKRTIAKMIQEYDQTGRENDMFNTLGFDRRNAPWWARAAVKVIQGLETGVSYLNPFKGSKMIGGPSDKGSNIYKPGWLW